MCVRDLTGQRFTRSLGLAPPLTGAEALRVARTLRKRHLAVVKLIEALEFARDCGCDLGYFWCLGCELVRPQRGDSRRRA
jgi:hypothetical protein